MSTAAIVPNISNGTLNRSINNNSKSKTTITYSSWNRKESCNYKINDYSVKDQYKVAAARGTLPTYLPTYLSTYLPIYLPTYLPDSNVNVPNLYMMILRPLKSFHNSQFESLKQIKTSAKTHFWVTQSCTRTGADVINKFKNGVTTKLWNRIALWLEYTISEEVL